jgi:hypothetical protein
MEWGKNNEDKSKVGYSQTMDGVDGWPVTVPEHLSHLAQLDLPRGLWQPKPWQARAGNAGRLTQRFFVRSANDETLLGGINFV